AGAGPAEWTKSRSASETAAVSVDGARPAACLPWRDSGICSRSSWPPSIGGRGPASSGADPENGGRPAAVLLAAPAPVDSGGPPAADGGNGLPVAGKVLPSGKPPSASAGPAATVVGTGARSCQPVSGGVRPGSPPPSASAPVTSAG